MTNDDREWIAAALAAMEERLVERMRDMQTELLHVFIPAQERTQTRESALEGRQNAVESRVASTERRLAEIEKRLLLNPPQ